MESEGTTPTGGDEGDREIDATHKDTHASEETKGLTDYDKKLAEVKERLCT